MENAVSPLRVQRALLMSAPALLTFVRGQGLSRAELEVVIADLATAKRGPGRTRRQAYDDYISRDGLGIELYRLLLTAPVLRHALQTRPQKERPETGSGLQGKCRGDDNPAVV